MKTIKQFVNGQVASLGQHTHPIENPALGETIAELEFINLSHLDDILNQSHRAFKAWSNTPALKRARVMFDFKQLVEQHLDELATLISQEHGKTLEDARGEVARGIEVIELHCGIANTLKGDFSNQVANGIDCHTVRQALGVCTGVSPFNFPVMVPLWMMVPAIACGNAFVLKPSEQAPSAPMRLAELFHQAGLPQGVLSVLNGDKTLVEALIEHPYVKAVTAVASTPVAEAIYTQATRLGKRAHTFGGAKNHCLVMPDADMEQAAHAIVGAAFGSAGERCMALSVAVTVGADTAERLLDAMTPLINDINIGEGLEPGVDMGPLVSGPHLNKVKQFITQGRQEGGVLAIDGSHYQSPTHPQGHFMGPCLFDHVDESMSIYQQEIFGPVLCMMRKDNFEQALELINTHQYGNGTAIFTRDGHAAREYSQRVEAGMVGVNIPIPVPVATHPFGGWKRSVFGDTNMHGKESVHFYTKLKTITTKWPATPSASNAFVMPTHK